MHTVDLHIHSWYSEDGTFMPEQLVKQCKAAGITRMAIADHNTVRGVASAVEEAKRIGIQCVPAIEIDCVLDGVNLHILGYDVDIENTAFALLEQGIAEQAEQASREMLQKVNALGLPVTAEELRALCRFRYRPDQWTGEIFGEALLAKPELLDNELLKPYRAGGERADNPLVNFYWDWFSQGKPCYVPMAYPQAEAALSLIHYAGGQAVLAHPAVNLKGREELLPALRALGLDGVEAQSSYHTREQAAYFAEQARALGLALSCGSDFHGETKPSIRLGDYPDLDVRYV